MIGIVILNYNNIQNTIDCINSLYRYSDSTTFALCLVDNNSSEQVKQAVRQYLHNKSDFFELTDINRRPEKLPSVTYLLNNKNGGYAKGNNIGLNYLKTYPEIEYYLILNNDILFTMDILTPLKQYMDQHQQVGVVSPLLYDKYGNIDYECARYEKKKRDFILRTFSFVKLKDKNKILKVHPEYLNTEEVNIELPSGSCMMFQRNVFETINFFDPNTFLYYEEDIIWKKLKKIGRNSILLPKLSCIHLGACSTSKSFSSIISESYKQSMLYYLKNYSGFSPVFVKLIEMKLSFKIKYRITQLTIKLSTLWTRKDS